MSNNTIRLSPLVRLKLSFDAELNLDKEGVLGIDTYEKYLETHKKSEEKQEKIIRSLFFTDAFLFLVMSGNDWSIPGLGIQISSIPAIQEILLFSSAMSFFILCTMFVTNQCYSAIIDQYGNRIVNSNLIDPDFFNASRKHYDFFLKIFRAKLNIWSDDFYQHGKSFAYFTWILNAMIGTIILIIPAMHFALAVGASIYVAHADWNLYGKILLIGSVAVINMGGLVMVIGMLKDFNFTIIEPDSTESTSD